MHRAAPYKRMTRPPMSVLRLRDCCRCHAILIFPPPHPGSGISPLPKLAPASAFTLIADPCALTHHVLSPQSYFWSLLFVRTPGLVHLLTPPSCVPSPTSAQQAPGIQVPTQMSLQRGCLGPLLTHTYFSTGASPTGMMAL